MPIHEYLCESCETRFDHLARRLGDKPAACPECGKARGLARQLSAFSAPRSASSPAPRLPAACGTCPGAAECGGGCFDGD